MIDAAGVIQEIADTLSLPISEVTFDFSDEPGSPLRVRYVLSKQSKDQETLEHRMERWANCCSQNSGGAVSDAEKDDQMVSRSFINGCNGSPS